MSSHKRNLEEVAGSSRGYLCPLALMKMMVLLALMNIMVSATADIKQIAFGGDLDKDEHRIQSDWDLHRGPCINALHTLWQTKGLFPSFLGSPRSVADDVVPHTRSSTTTPRVDADVVRAWIARVRNLPIAMGRYEYLLNLVLFLLSKRWAVAEVVGCGKPNNSDEEMLVEYMNLRLAVVIMKPLPRRHNTHTAGGRDEKEETIISEPIILIDDLVNDVLTKVDWSRLRFSKSLFPLPDGTPVGDEGRFSYAMRTCHPYGSQGIPPILELPSFTHAYGADYGQVMRMQTLLQGTRLMNMCRLDKLEMNA